MIDPAKVFQKTMSEIEQTSYQEIAGCKRIFIFPSALPPPPAPLPTPHYNKLRLVKKCDTLGGKKHI